MTHPKDRHLSNAEKAVIAGLWRQCQNVLMIMGVMELRQDTVEEVLQNYIGMQLATYETTINQQ